jgi:hypothetical protein
MTDVFKASSASTSVSYAVTTSDASPPPYYFRAFATATNAAGTSSIAVSNIILSSLPVSIPSGGTVSISTNTGNYTVGSIITYSTTGWANTPTSYSLRLYNGTNPVLTSDPLRASTSSTSGTYTITSADVPNYFKAFATASNSAGTSTEASSAQVGPAVAAVSIPSGGTVTLTGSTTAGSVITASTSGWSGSPTSYDVFITTTTSGTPTSSSTRVSSSGGASSTAYTITASDASSPVNIFRAFATASNSAGTSSTAQSSNTITATASGGGGGAVPVLISLTGNNSLQYGGTFTWSFSNSPTAYSIFVSGPNGTVYSTSNAYTYSTTTFRPGYDGNISPPPFPSGSYTINVSAQNASGNSTTATVTTFMS